MYKLTNDRGWGCGFDWHLWCRSVSRHAEQIVGKFQSGDKYPKMVQCGEVRYRTIISPWTALNE